MSLHTWCHQGTCKPSIALPSRLTVNGAELPQAKKSLVPMRAGSLWQCLTLCDPVDGGLPGFSIRERVSPGKNTGVYWQILVAIPFYSTKFPAVLAANSPENLVLP